MIRKKNKNTDPNVISIGYRFRIYPTPDQKEFFAKHFGCTRFVYNHFRHLRKDTWEKEKKTISGFACKRMLPDLKKKYNWLKECNSQSLQQSVLELEEAYQRFFDKKLPNGYPQDKKKHHRQSFTVPQHFKTRITGKGKFLLNIPKLKSDIRVNAHRQIPGDIERVVISKSRTDKYFVSFKSQIDKRELPGKKKIPFKEIGIDLGLKDTIVTSDGEKIDNPNHLERSLKRLKKESKRLSRKKKGSNNRLKQRIIVARLHEKIANQRKDFLHKISFRLVNENQVIHMESLDVKGMMKNKRLARRIAGTGIGELVRQIKYKAEWRNRQTTQIGRFEPSSKMCSEQGCTYIKINLELSDRIWVCPECGAVHDRDINAALNILKIGKDIARINACGENNRCSDQKRSDQVDSLKQEPDLIEV